MTVSDTPALPVAEAMLTNGRYRVRLSAGGAGASALAGWTLTRDPADPTLDAGGWYWFLRDLDSGEVWSAGYQPVRRPPSRYDVRLGAMVASILREDDGIETRMEVLISPDADLEWRRLTLTNTGPAPRRIEVTSYLEAALNTPGADAGHPAFSKLFLETGFLAALGALECRRRPRSPDDPALCMVHAVIAPDASPDLQYETDRARFLGRGRTLQAPAALLGTARLSGTVGSVLDPILSLRRSVALAPGGRASLDGILAAGIDREGVHHAVRSALRNGAGDAFDRRLPRDEPAAAPVELPLAPVFRPAPGSDAPADTGEPLLFWNGGGGFSEAGDEYVIRMSRTPDGLVLPPQPWTNVVANPWIGFVASERGPGFTWYGNSRQHRLTPWSNDPVSDPAGEALYLRDEERGLFWSPTPGPVPGSGSYEVRHGFGYSVWRHASQSIGQEVLCFVETDAPVKITRLRVTNLGDRPRRLSAYWYAEWVLGVLRGDTAQAIETAGSADRTLITAINPLSPDYRAGVAFAAVAGPAGLVADCTTDREAFLGRWGSAAGPQALEEDRALGERAGPGLDPVAAFRLPLALAPGETVELVYLLGYAESAEAAAAVPQRYRDPARAAGELERARSFWSDLLGAVRVETPSRALDLLVNGWLSYQNLSCRVWARSAFYQSGGAFGFRDQLQDAAALVYHHPDFTRRQILLHAAHQFTEGDVLHWWHSPDSRGIRTRFSDDLLWLPHVTAFYVDTTGDTALLEEAVGFLAGPALDPGEDERLITPDQAGVQASVFEHCCRALDRSLTRGRHGLPLIGSGDWNDGMNRVGREGLGESVWLGFFLHPILTRFAEWCVQRGESDRAARYREYLHRLAEALDADGWDGRWYRRAYYDDGEPLGSAASDEARIDAIAQAWAVLSGVAPAGRASAALDSVEAHLIDESAGLIRLLTPPFDRTPHDPGYIKGYLPGVRENGGQYTHGALWVVRALAEAGRHERAAHLFEMLTPIHHADSPEAVAVYQVEPYVVAADVYAVAPHVGRGGWTWYTGSAGWMFRVALETILGVTLRGGRELALRPCIPVAWKGFTVRIRLPDGGTVYEVVVRRARRSLTRWEGAEARGEDGALVIAVAHDGAMHRVEVELGADVGPRYRSVTPDGTS